MEKGFRKGQKWNEKKVMITAMNVKKEISLSAYTKYLDQIMVDRLNVRVLLFIIGFMSMKMEIYKLL